MAQQWVIVGTGAVGSILGARLLQQNQRVTFITREPQSNPRLTLTGHTQFDGPIHTLSQANISQAPQQAVWVFPVKAWQLAEAISNYAPALQTAAHLIISHNGLGAAEQELAALPQEKIIDWVTTHGGWRQCKCHTEHSGLGQSWLGFRATPASTAAPPHWWPTFHTALASNWEPNIHLKRWHKLAINCAINPIAALENKPNGVLQAAEFQHQIQAVCDEIATLMNLELKASVASTALYQQVQQVITGTAANINSMLQDIRAKRPTEIDYLNGFVHKKGRQLHVPTPVNTQLWQAIKQL